jgi:hypothetical protein
MHMNAAKLLSLSALASGLLVAASFSALAGPLDPDCTPEKAAKGAAAKSTVGVGGRCSAGEAAKDSAKRTAGIEDKGPLEKKGKDNAGPAKGAVKKAVD